MGFEAPQGSIFGRTLTVQSWVSPDYELALAHGIGDGTGGAVAAVTSFSGGAPEPSVFGPAVDEKGWANFTQNNEQIMQNMRAIKSLVDLYANGHGGNFPATIEELNAALAEGNKEGLLNPCTQKREFPRWGGVVDVQAARKSAPKVMMPGSIEYNVLPGGRAYAIMAGDAATGKAMLGDDSKGSLVLSNI